MAIPGAYAQTEMFTPRICESLRASVLKMLPPSPAIRCRLAATWASTDTSVNRRRTSGGLEAFKLRTPAPEPDVPQTTGCSWTA
ncbi:MAG: hypothetical protein BWX48_02650 [Verrucomicrobia bacterium ADurb.Bin006]|nr:MAG: hypothetical protein BWX48_02650 [Verrucomicrobia bacterium ADurb.Bin006]